MADQHAPEQNESRTAALIANSLAVVGLIILLVIVIWGFLHLASLSSGWFSSFFKSSPKAESSIAVKAPARVISGTPTLISWDYKPAESGTYALLYTCAGGLELASPGAEHTAAPIPCGTGFALQNASSSVFVVPLLAATTSVKTTITILYMPARAGGTSAVSPIAQGSVDMTVTPRPVPQGTTPGAPGTPSAPAKPAQPAPSGPANLSVRILSVSGEGATGAVAVVFDIANTGHSTTGAYYFEAQLPTSQPYVYISPAQAPLSPGSHVVNTLRFTQAAQGGGVFTVTVDPQNLVRESSERDNTASQPVAVPSYNNSQYNYQPSYNYGY